VSITALLFVIAFVCLCIDSIDLQIGDKKRTLFVVNIFFRTVGWFCLICGVLMTLNQFALNWWSV
jgi:hypothetical protein